MSAHQFEAFEGADIYIGELRTEIGRLNAIIQAQKLHLEGQSAEIGRLKEEIKRLDQVIEDLE